MRLFILLLLLGTGIALAGCAQTGAPATSSGKSSQGRKVRPPAYIPPPNRPVVRPPPSVSADGVMGLDAGGLMQKFGQAKQDVREEGARKLQFSNQLCVLDAYLYPASKGLTPVVTYITTRTPDGRDAERNSCIAALQRR